MTGIFDYLKVIRKTCIEHNKDCNRCPLGNYENIQDTLCPALTPPWQWRDSKLARLEQELNRLGVLEEGREGEKGEADESEYY